MPEAPQSQQLSESIRAAVGAASATGHTPVRASSTDEAVVVEVSAANEVRVQVAGSLLRLGPETVAAAVAEAVTQLLTGYTAVGTVPPGDQAAVEEALRGAEDGLAQATARMEEQLARLSSRIQQGPPPFPQRR